MMPERGEPDKIPNGDLQACPPHHCPYSHFVQVFVHMTGGAGGGAMSEIYDNLIEIIFLGKMQSIRFHSTK